MTLADAVQILAPQSKLITVPGFYDLTAAEYHQDPVCEPSFSASIGEVIIDRSPMHAKCKHPRLQDGASTDDSSSEMDFGSAVHAMALGKGGEFETLDFKDWKTNAAKDARAVAHADGRLPVLKHVMERAKVCALAFRRQLEADPAECAIFDAGRSEQILVAEFGNLQSTKQSRVWARGMIDRLTVDRVEMRVHIRDIKTTENASPESVRNRVSDGYMAMKLATYEWLIETLMPEFAGRIDSKLYFLETHEPFAMQPYELDGSGRQLGRLQLGRAWDSWQRCIATGEWPGYSPRGRTLTVAPKPWDLSREIDMGGVL